MAVGIRWVAVSDGRRVIWNLRGSHNSRCGWVRAPNTDGQLRWSLGVRESACVLCIPAGLRLAGCSLPCSFRVSRGWSHTQATQNSRCAQVVVSCTDHVGSNMCFQTAVEQNFLHVISCIVHSSIFPSSMICKDSVSGSSHWAFKMTAWFPTAVWTEWFGYRLRFLLESGGWSLCYTEKHQFFYFKQAPYVRWPPYFWCCYQDTLKPEPDSVLKRHVGVYVLGGSFRSSVVSVHCGSITTQLRSRFPELHLTALVCLLGYRENEVLLIFLSFHHFLGFTFETLIFMPWARKSAFPQGIYISPSCLGIAWCFHSLLHASLLEHRSHCFGVSWSWLLSLNKLQLFQGMDHIFLIFTFFCYLAPCLAVVVEWMDGWMK